MIITVEHEDKENNTQLVSISFSSGEHIQPISKTSISSFLDYHSKNGFVMVSAFREDKTKGENKKDDEELEKNIQEEGWSYTPIWGYVYDNGERVRVNEKAFIVYNMFKNSSNGDMQALKDFAIKMCKEHEQDSVIIKEPNKEPALYNKDGEMVDELGGNLAIKDLAQRYFSTISRSGGKLSTGSSMYSFKENEESSSQTSKHLYAECCYVYSITTNERWRRTHNGEIIPPVLGLWDDEEKK